MNILALLVALIVFCLVVWAARTIMAGFALPAPLSTLIYVVIVVLGVLWVLQTAGLTSGHLVFLGR